MGTRVLVAASVILGLLGVGTIAATSSVNAAVPDASAFFTGPIGGPVGAGTSNEATVQFSLASDVGPIVVAVQAYTSTNTATLTFDPANTSSELSGCDDSIDLTITCDWDGVSANSPQTLAFILEVDPDAPLDEGFGIEATVDSLSDDDPPQSVASSGVYVTPPAGSTVLSGRVITDDGAPVPGACIFVLTPSFVYPVVADADGEWLVAELADDFEAVLGIFDAFSSASGPCQTEDGPPPAAAPGELQPVFHENVWLDIEDPDLGGENGNPFAYGVASGATLLTGTTSGIVTCLTDAPPNEVPRPDCVLEVTDAPTTPTTTTASASTTSTSTTTTAPVTTTTEDPDQAVLAITGSQHAPLFSAVAMGLIMIGIATVVGSRRRSAS
ncbi:MAG: hypothetical protein RIB98_17135 [Acidimicrobiales bacterium]